MHIAVVGAGISGLLTALELVEQGCSVSIFDQHYAGQAASWAGGGILSPMYPWRYPLAVNQLARYGKRLYEEWNNKLLKTTGIDFEIYKTGMLILDEKDFEIGLDYSSRYQDPMQNAQYVTQNTLQLINPKVNPTFQHGIYFPYLSNIRNPRLLQSLIKYLKQHPLVHFFEHSRIIHLTIQQAQVVSAFDQHNHQIQADHFVIASGAWTQHWSNQLKLLLPIQPIKGQMLLFKTPVNWLTTMCMNNTMYLIPRQDGHIVCGSSMLDCGFNTTIDPKVSQNILENCLKIVPELRQFPIIQQWAGLRPSSPTGIPYIGQIPSIKNLWINAGHFRNGLCMGPASARLLRQLLLQQPTFIDPKPYSPQRLAKL